MKEALERIAGGLIVSCQADEGSPLDSAWIQATFAEVAVRSGAVGIRACGVEHLRAIKQRVSVPVIGLEKLRLGFPVYITPAVESARRIIEAGAEIVAFDATARARPDGSDLADLIAVIHEAGRVALADIATVDDARRAFLLGADCVATTLAGHTEDTRAVTLPALDLVREIARLRLGPVLCEGGVQEPWHVTAALEAGAHAVVVGKAITGLDWIVRRFVAATRSASGRRDV